MIPSNPAPAPKSFPLPQDLIALLPHPLTPWNCSLSLFNRVQAYTSDKSFKLCEVLNTDPEFNFILRYFEHQKPQGYSIKRIVCIHNPDHTGLFELALKNMERESNNPIFSPKGREEEPRAERARVLTRWEHQVAQFSPVEVKSSTSRGVNSCSKVKVLPLWHGSSKAVCQSVCWSGFTSFGKHHYFDESASKGSATSTDKGYFGSGIYFTNSAQYATMYSSEGHLLLTWISMREPYPVVNDKPHPQKGSDMIKLGGKEHYQNYNAHFIPVASIRPHDPKCLEYYPCYKDQPPAWDEFVVFYPAQALPRFWIELGVDLPKVILSDMANTGEFLTLLLSLLNKEEIKNHSTLSGVLQAHVTDLLKVSKEASLNVEEQKFFKLAKQLLPEGETISSSVVHLLLQNNPPMRQISISKPSPQPTATKGSNSEKPRKPLPSLPTHKPQSNSLPLGEEDYLKGYSLTESGDLKQAFLNYEKAAEQGHTKAQYSLGLCYAIGQGVAQDYKEAVKWYQKSADRDFAYAQHNLGVCYGNGQGVAQDHREAAKWFQKAADQGNATAQYNLGLCYKNGRGIAQDYKKAAEWYQKAAGQGHAGAQSNLGVCYEIGQGVAQDYKEAVKWYQKAAGQGHAGAQSNLGVCYEIGQGVAQDFTEAAKWYRKAAEQGRAAAQSNLGVCYENGRGVDKDHREAAKWYQKAADQGHAPAQYNLGLCYENGQGVDKDHREAAKWYQKAADQGHAPAQYNLGLCYENGRGVDKDHREAAKWYQKAADQGHAPAQYNLGLCYENGRGVVQDYKEAVKWYRKAADQDIAEAQYNLGFCYAKGQGVAQDYQEAVKWYQKAADQGVDYAQHNLGSCYANGEGVVQDLKEAMKWYQKAAGQGLAAAQYILGSSYDTGKGVDKDPKEAVKWYQKAAEQGYAKAQYDLGLCYEKGQGVDQDLKEAVKWYQKAAALGYDKANISLRKNFRKIPITFIDHEAK